MPKLKVRVGTPFSRVIWSKRFRRKRVVKAARPEKKRIELVLVLREEFQFFRDAFGNGRRQERVINKARRQKRAEPKGDANESISELFVHTGSCSCSCS